MLSDAFGQHQDRTPFARQLVDAALRTSIPQACWILVADGFLGVVRARLLVANGRLPLGSSRGKPPDHGQPISPVVRAMAERS
jgi:hypothetical protein